MKKYRLTKKGFHWLLSICVVLAVGLGFCLSFVLVYHVGKQKIFAMSLDEAARIVEEAQQTSGENPAAQWEGSAQREVISRQDDIARQMKEENTLLPAVILFEKDIACLNEKEYVKMKAFSELAQERRAERVRVAGHAAFSDDEAGGDGLSYLRAKAVKEYLIYCGVDETRIDIEAHGYHKPADTEDVTSFRNRRVELSFE